MWKNLASLAVIGALTVGMPLAAAPASAAELYEQCKTAWGSQSKDVVGREFKFLVDPAKTQPGMKDAFKDIWKQTKAVLEQNGVKVNEKEKKAFSLSPVVKTFFDTPNFDLYKKGYLIRTTTNYKKGYAQSPMKVVIKRLGVPFKTVMKSPLQIKNAKGKTVAEDNIGMGKDGKLLSYVEKNAGFNATRADLGEMNLADFAVFMPELLKIGLPANTKLEAYPAFGTRCRPGSLEIPGLEHPTSVSMEAWARTEGGEPFVYDFSFGYDGDFDKMTAAHKAAEKATRALYKDLNGKLGFENPGRWAGSKVRVLLNQPK